jgi:hypothetical protein
MAKPLLVAAVKQATTRVCHFKGDGIVYRKGRLKEEVGSNGKSKLTL